MDAHKEIFSKIGFNYLLLALIPIIFQIFIANIVSLIDASLLNDINVQTLIGSLTSYIIIFPIFIYLMRKIESSNINENRLNVIGLLKCICIAITLMIVGNLIGTVITTLIGNTMSNEVINPVEQLIENSSIYINLLIICIVAPIFEEIFFRKILIERTIKYGAKLSIILSALIFALFHGNLSQFFYAFFLGGFLAYLYINTGKIIYPIIIHACVNFYGSVVSIFFSSAAENIAQGMMNTGDMGIIALYFTVLFIALFVGLYEIFTKYDKIELNDSKREIYLEKPAKTVLLNVGMILLIIYFILKILTSLNIIMI
ncbi:MAG: CPBP family intramembrane metalloprotease [Methanobrevibacter sp.]|uniref:CPBP family intramembrane glutamic endopeptidase n=1 Tax=Methanobrevibacter sp. TaxID=66852 RepID=UPI0025DD535B|nr:type II CAAX endopeptidase family protein [Methanobrevibacter sp.]MBR0271541.1 CPBP family intramembrane metalloprotease [Methanobrevibacter sp.]